MPSLAEYPRPVIEHPLRLPGQSVQQEIDRLVDNEMVYSVIIMIVAVVWAVNEWIRWLVKAPPNPWSTTGVAILMIVYSVVRLVRASKRLRALKLGRDGERVVAEELDKMKSTGAVVFHDILASRFNVDHVILSRHGVYAVETKTISRPSGRGSVVFDGRTLRVAGRTLERDPIAQVTAEAEWIRRTLKEMTTRDYPARPVLVFPGWLVNPVREHRNARVWVLNPKALCAFVSNEPAIVSKEDLALAVFCLARHIRNTPDHS